MVEEEEDEFSYENRYFNFNPAKFCNRCKKLGHFERMCPEEVKMACRVCLGGHLMDECDKSTCFKCAGFGHRVRECPFREDT